MVAIGCLAVLTLAAYLQPSSAGHGTHTQLGMPPCGWVMAFNRPCPTCGMTTSFSYAAHMRLWSSFVAQPAGCLLAVLTASGFWAAVHVAATGSALGGLLARILRPAVLWPALVVLVAAWGYKIVTWNNG
ncbi:MAG: DUF2752 domain-containing protein [Planctomycetes bacterium]|nr:DUF2752 domain-containing protein [Planctomycetota bacterium]